MVSAATRIDGPPLRAYILRVGELDSPGCSERTLTPDGADLYADCFFGGGVYARGRFDWSSQVDTTLPSADAAWFDAWTSTRGAPSEVGHLDLWGRFVWSDEAGPLLHAWGAWTNTSARWEDAAASRTWADGPLSDRLAASTSWTGSGMIPAMLEVGRLVSDDGDALLTVDGALGELPAAFPTASVLGGAWRAAGPGCVEEPAGSWSLRDDAGVWYDLSFDPDVACDGCGVARAVGALDTPVCLDDAARAAVRDLVAASPP